MILRYVILRRDVTGETTPFGNVIQYTTVTRYISIKGPLLNDQSLKGGIMIVGHLGVGGGPWDDSV